MFLVQTVVILGHHTVLHITDCRDSVKCPCNDFLLLSVT